MDEREPFKLRAHIVYGVIGQIANGGGERAGVFKFFWSLLQFFRAFAQKRIVGRGVKLSFNLPGQDYD